MIQINGRTKILAVVLSIFVVMMPIKSYAADVKILQTNVYEDDIYIFVKGISELSGDSVIQIGNTPCRTEQISTSTFGRMNPFMRTLILVDNSKSIPEINHEDIQEILKGIILNSKENELIKIGTFSRETAFLCDYTSDHAILENIINNISYNDQDTYLSDVLYNTISDLKAENTFVCTRIIILSDGADDNFIGYTNDEVRRYVESNQYPVYTIGLSKKNNASQLETMFSFSRAANTDFFLIDGSIANADIVNCILTDQTGICLKITPDESLKDGSNKSILLKLSTAEGVFELKTSVEMPFGDGSDIQPEPEPVPEPTTESDSLIPDISPTPTSEVADHIETDKNNVLRIFILLLVVAAVMFAVIVVVVLNRRKKVIPSTQPVPSPQPTLPPDDNDDTFIPGNNQSDPNREPEKKLWSEKQLVLRNLDNPNVFFKVPIKDVVCIGRRSTQDIVIDDPETSKEHCKIILRGSLMYLVSCNHSNGTYYENVLVHEGDEIPIVSGGKLKIGKYQYQVELMDN